MPALRTYGIKPLKMYFCRFERRRIMPLPTNKLIALSAGIAMTLPMLIMRNFFVPVFMVWFLVNLLRDIGKTGKLYPYRFENKIMSWVGNSWLMMMLTFLLWCCGVFG